MKYKKGFTLLESLVAMLIVSVIGMSSIYIANGYYKQTFARDRQLKSVIQNINTIESLKTNVHTLSDLYDFANENMIRIIAVGIGEVTLNKNADGKITINKVSDERFDFTDKLKPNDNLFRIEVGVDIPNTKLMTILRLDGE